MSIIFYDLVAGQGSPLFSPNTFKARLSLLQKDVQFETREVTYQDLRTHLRERLGRKALVPMIELQDGTIISESHNIADWLEKTYPNASSLFLPGEALPVNTASPAYITAKNFSRLVDSGLGDSDSGWGTFWELSAQGIQASLLGSDASYMKSDEKLGKKDGWDKIVSLDQDALVLRAMNSLLPIESVLSGSDWLAGSGPGYVDYVVYGRYMMMASSVPKLAADVWKGKPAIKAWIARLEDLYAVGLADVLRRLPSQGA